MITLGKLVFESAVEAMDLVSNPTKEALENFEYKDKVGVSKIDPELSDTAAFCEEYNIQPSLAANCVVVEAKRGGERWLAACIILASTRADVNGIVRQTLEAKKVSFASMEKAVNASQMEYGAITPIGLPSDWKILVDKAVAESEYVIVGSGIRSSKIALPGSVLASLPNTQVLDGLGMSA